ncbi:MAG: hypothetical protein ISS31_07865 [Kiritimatiellae bacterium]|nr:hypothetical protein [Kiritimatiellia bacterium]
MRYGTVLLCVMLMLAVVMSVDSSGADAEQTDALQWPISHNRGQIELFKVHGIPTGSVAQTDRTFENWGNASTVTWHIANNVAGEYKPTLSYRSSHDVACTLTIGDESYEGVLKKGEGVLKHPAPAVPLNRIGIYPVTLSISADSPEHDFELTDLRLRHVAGVVAMSKPVLIAGADWLKVQGSLQINIEDVDRAKVHIDASIRPWPDGDVLWKGPVPVTAVPAGLEIDHTVTDLQPQLWSPATPNLYVVALDVHDGRQKAPALRVESRIGFRDFKAKDGRFYLNGQPIFLRGNAIIPPGWGHIRGLNPDVGNDPDSIRQYITKLKAFHVNLIRVHDPVWLGLCDEMGIMVFTGRYGVPKWGDARRHESPTFEEGAVTYYKHRFSEAYMNHPSVVMWVLTNEMPSAMSEGGRQYIAFLRQCHKRLVQWDPTRAYIENAGFGLGQGADVNDLHVYMGWYNGVVQSVYKFRYDLRKLAGLPSPVQPMTFTEIIGAYTDELGRMPGTGKQVSAGLMWGGNESDVPEHAMNYQSYLTRQFLEIMRRLRPINPTIAGLMPFTTTALGWETAQSVDEIQFKPHIAEGYAAAYQPVLLSFENWRPHVYAGDRVRLSAHLINDADDGRDISGAALKWRLVKDGDGSTVQSGSVAFAETVRHYATDTQELVLELGEDLGKGQYALQGDVVENGETISSNDTEIWVEPRQSPALATSRKVTLFDPLGETRPILEKAGLVEDRDYYITTSPFAGMTQFDRLSGSQLQETLGVEDVSGDTLVAPSRSLFIVGSKLWVEPLRDKYLLMKEFIQRGGRVVFLHPNAYALNDIGLLDDIMVTKNEWVGDRASVELESLWHTSRFFGAWINPRRSDTRIFDGIDREQLWLWSDPSGWDPSQPDLPEFEPVNTFMKLRNADALDSTAILANFGRGLEHVALAEVFRGEGSVILSGFDFERFAGFDPIAAKVLRGVIAYAADDQQHAIVPEAKDTTNIGSPSDEDGIVPSEFRNGLLLEYHKDYEGTDYQVRRIAGPFWFNRLCHTKFIDPDNEVRRAFMHVRPPNGKTEIVFHARRVETRENKGRYKPAVLTISIGEQKVEASITGEEDVEVRLPLPEDRDGPLRVDFRGVSDIGISSMSFE